MSLHSTAVAVPQRLTGIAFVLVATGGFAACGVNEAALENKRCNPNQGASCIAGYSCLCAHQGCFCRSSLAGGAESDPVLSADGGVPASSDLGGPDGAHADLAVDAQGGHPQPGVVVPPPASPQQQMEWWMEWFRQQELERTGSR